MNKYVAQRLAQDLMNEHLGYGHGWTLKFDNAKNRLGVCKHGKKVIGLSLPIVLMNEEDLIRDTILHEIAHVLAGPAHGHDFVWMAKCRQVGARPQRCVNSSEMVAPKPKYSAPCPGCGKEIGRHRLSAGQKVTIACGDCCRRHNHGRFTDRFAVVLTTTGCYQKIRSNDLTSV